MTEAGRNAVIVGFDLSEASRQAVWWAAREADLRRAPLLLMHAFDWPFMELTPVHVGDKGEVVESLQQAMRHELENLVEGCQGIAPDLDVRTELISGDPPRVLGEAAEEAALLVVGASGFGGLYRGSAGSTTAEVVARRSRTPVVVVRSDNGTSPTDTGRVVLGVDGSQVSGLAIGFAYDFAARHGAELVAVHAWSDRPLEPFTRRWEIDRTEVSKWAYELLARSLEGWEQRYPNVPVRRSVSPERPAQALFTEAAGARLLVLGTHGRGRIRRAMLGSVSHAAVHHAPCPVALLHSA